VQVWTDDTDLKAQRPRDRHIGIWRALWYGGQTEPYSVITYHQTSGYAAQSAYGPE